MDRVGKDVLSCVRVSMQLASIPLEYQLKKEKQKKKEVMRQSGVNTYPGP